MSYIVNLKELTMENMQEEWEAWLIPELKDIYFYQMEVDGVDEVIHRISDDFYMQLMWQYELRDGVGLFYEFMVKKIDWLRLQYKLWNVQKKIAEIEKDFQ